MAPPSSVSSRRALASSSRRAAPAASAAGHHATTPAVVIEFGSSHIRIGLSGEPNPRHVLRTPDNLPLPSAGRPPASPSAPTPTKSARAGPYGEDDWEEVLYPFLSAALADLLLLRSVRSRRVLVLEPFVSPSSFRAATCRVLLVRLGVASVLFVPGSLSVVLPYGLGLGGGVVVDVGRWEGRVAVAGDGGRGVLVETFRAVPCGFDSLVQTFMTAHNDSCPASCTIPSLEDGREIVRTCLDADPSSNELQLMVPSSGRLISADPQLVQSCIDELFFDPFNPESLVHAFLSALSACAIDIRRDSVRNVVLVGGTVERLPNFERKFLKSVKEAIEPPGDGGDATVGVIPARFRPLRRLITESGPLGIVHPLPFAPSILAWTSASAMGTLEIAQERWIHQQAFVEWDGVKEEKEGEGSDMIYDFLSSMA